MEVSSPPKRMTRARAAAKAGSDPAPKSTKVVTAAPAKHTAARAASSTKRKTRADDNENHEESQTTNPPVETMDKPARTRGRPKKVVDPELETAAATTSTTRATRGRAKKEISEPSKPEPAKTTRTRTKKTQADDTKTDAPQEAVKKTTRGRAASKSKAPGIICNEATTEPTPGLRSAVSRPASRIGIVKKSVTFQEPEKENMVPARVTKAKSKTEAETATGMRAKPVRKTAAGGTRATRASTRTAPVGDRKDKPTPLSPKKDSQNRPLSRTSNSDDDELATFEKTPLKPMMKSPVKPPTNKRPDICAPTATEAATAEQREQQPDELAGNSVFSSPARRPPSTPFYDTMKSPAKRAEGVPTLLFSPKKSDAETSQSPLKMSMLQSPAKRPQVPLMSLQAPQQESTGQLRSPSKMSLLQSPAKRPMSPAKLVASPFRPVDAHVPSSQVVSPAVEEDALMTADQGIGGPMGGQTVAEDVTADVEMMQEEVGGGFESPDPLDFPGRLSAVLPRFADPALQDRPSPIKALSTEQLEPIEFEEIAAIPQPPANEHPETDPMDIDEVQVEETGSRSPPADTPTRPAVRPANAMFGLRQKDLVPYDGNDSEDELASSFKTLPIDQDDATLSFSAAPATPTPGASRTPRGALPSSAIKNASRAIRSVSRGSKLGFTPLARQLSGWQTGSPLKGSAMKATQASAEEQSLLEVYGAVSTPSSPSEGAAFFEDEMSVRAEMIDIEVGAEDEIMAALEADVDAAYDDPILNGIPITSEDVELAVEANEMSLLEAEEHEHVLDARTHDDSVSDASQEYGDENALPIDPALLNTTTGHVRQSATALLPTTPRRPTSIQPFNTTTKVPLKPADDSTPRSTKRRSASVSRLSMKRPVGPFRNATVISYSPVKESDVTDRMETDEQDDQPITPVKSDIWSSMGTPARTPRRDLNPALLRGAVVFVDVHTTEGADASTVFVELLTQMGARCVKSWPWNPTSPTNGESSTSKVGITHVVFKDGGKRTMEKVRESGGVVQCVGVGWVLDCERENEWLDEAPYYIDTSLVPRGGARRRKSMEPKALANLNGTLVTPMKQPSAPARDCQTVPNNHISRRDSTVWMRSPSNPDEDEDMEDADEIEWDRSMLTPVPKTPAPEALHRYVTEMEITPETPTAEWTYEDSPQREQVLLRTAPPKQSAYTELGAGLLSQQKDQSVLMRLMAARRKSLQFAPKIASPLSKAWN